jgi:hypothetical protein
MKSQKIEEDLYCLLTRNSNATICQLHLKPFEDKNPQLLFMGMHYLNNACLIYKIDSPAYQKGRKLNNCKLIDDGTLITLAKVSPGRQTKD